MTMCQYYDKNIPIKQSKKYIPSFPFKSSPSSSTPQQYPLLRESFRLPNLINHYNNMDNTDIVQQSLAPENDDFRSNKVEEKVHNQCNQEFFSSKGISQLFPSIQVIDDVTLLRRQLKYFSKISLKFSRKIYKQQEQIERMTVQLQDCQHMYQQECAKKQQLVSEIAHLKVSHCATEREVTLREKMLAEELTEADSTRIDIMDRIQMLEGQNRILHTKLRDCEKKLIKQKQNLTLKDYSIDQLNVQIKEMRDHLDQERFKIQDKQAEISTLKNKLSEATEDCSEAKAQVALLKLQNRELERQLSQFKRSYKKIEEIELIKLTSKGPQEQKSQKLVEESQSLSYDQLLKKYQLLQNHYSTLKNEATYLQYRIQSMTNDERDAEHIVIDRFIQVLNIYRDKLKQGEAPLKKNIQMKKEAFLRRLGKEYQKFIDTVPLN